MTTKEKAQRLIERLGRCNCGGRDDCKFTPGDEPILIGDVLGHMARRGKMHKWQDLCELWFACSTDEEIRRLKTALTKSLQEIASDRTTNRSHECSPMYCNSCCRDRKQDELKPESAALLDFLYPLIFGE